MAQETQLDLLAQIKDLDLVRDLVADLHDDLHGKVERYRHLADLAAAHDIRRTMMPGGEVVWAAWSEARASFIQGNYMATVLLCQGLAEHMLASHLVDGLGGEELPRKISFRDTLKRCLARNVITRDDAIKLEHLMELRNPLSHFRSIDDPMNLSRRAIDGGRPAQIHLRNDASFAINMALRLLALPVFRLDTEPEYLKFRRDR